MNINKTLDYVNIIKLHNRHITEWVIIYHDDIASNKKWEENCKKLTEIKDIFDKHVIKTIGPEKYTFKNMSINEEGIYEVSFCPETVRKNYKMFIIIKRKKGRILVKELHYEIAPNVFDIKYTFVTLNQINYYYSHKKINKKDWYRLIRTD